MISNGAPPKVATTYLITGEYEFVRQRQRVCEKEVETKSRKPPRRPTLDLFDETMDAILGTCANEKMDVIKHGLEFSQLSPSKDAHLGNDFLEPSAAILLSMLAVLWIVGDNRSTVLGTPYNVIATAVDNVVIGF